MVLLCVFHCFLAIEMLESDFKFLKAIVDYLRIEFYMISEDHKVIDFSFLVSFVYKKYNMMPGTLIC